ncbi:MAG: hypothetical protein R3228_10840 [Halioglobus sp.]|nr:hypothetical protein [Halioglobus sp.]
MDYISVQEAVTAPGLRLVLTAGVPGPWGESAKAILDYKGIGFLPVHQEGGGANEELLAWTGQNSAPVAVYEDLPPVCHWLDLLMLAERLAPHKPLLPEAPGERADVLGLSALLAGVDGFAWNRRLQMFAPAMALAEPPDIIARMAHKYGWSEQALAAATAKICSIAAELDGRLEAQERQGREYLVGDTVSAADFYWANFAGMVDPLGPADNPMPDYMRSTYESADARTRGALTPRLLAHRDRMYQRHIKLPLDF